MRGIDASIWFTNVGKEGCDAAADKNLRVISSTDSGGSLLGKTLSLRTELRETAASIVHLHLPPPWLAASLPLRRNYGLVSHLHVDPIARPRRTPVSHLMQHVQARGVLSRSDLLISISRWIEAEWCSAYPSLQKKIRIIYNGTCMPADTAVRTRKDGLVIGMATRLVPGKGVEEFLELAGRVHEMAPKIRFRVAGDGPMRTEYYKLSCAKGIDGVLSFCGFVKDIASFWRDVDLAAFTGPAEPFGLRLIEPIAHGVPVVAYANGTGSDEIIARCRGIVARDYGNVFELARVAVGLCQSDELRSRLVEDGLKDIRLAFSIERMEADVRSAYQDVLHAPAASSARSSIA
jgi:glycosyltransferase involved in cell wall biosynthesis